MKLLRFGEPGQEKPGILDANGVIRDISGKVDDINSAMLGDSALQSLRGLTLEDLPAVEGSPRLGSPISDIRKILCIGLNYSDHAEESGMAVPAEPVLFMKADTSITGPHDDVIIPQNSTKLDWEVELGVIIGKTAHYVDEADALDYVAGYCVSQ